MIPLLSIIIFFPLLCCFPIAVFQTRQTNFYRYYLILSQLVLVGFLFFLLNIFDFTADSFQFIEKIEWIAAFNIYYSVGIDKISLIFLCLFIGISLVILLGTWGDITLDFKQYAFLFLIMQSAALGVILALDFFLFYIFWEIVLIPLYFIVGKWGEKEKRISSAVTMFIYTMVGSLFMLLSIIVVAIMSKNDLQGVSFSMIEWQNLQLDSSLEVFVFWGFALAFLVKIPLFPFHSWQPSAYSIAPWGSTLFMAAILSKIGVYGFLRIIPLFPTAFSSSQELLLIIATVSIFYASILAMQQKNLRVVIAYSSIAHLGVLMVGIFSFNEYGWFGGILQVINHSLTSFAIFLSCYYLINRSQTLEIRKLKGIVHSMPFFTTVFMIILFASIGLPGLSNFIGEIAIFIGSYQISVVLTICVVSSMLLSAVYMLSCSRAIFFGNETHIQHQYWQDITRKEFLILLPSLFLFFYLGLFPNHFFSLLNLELPF